MPMLLAALYWAILPQRGLRFAPPCVARDYRWCDHGSIMGSELLQPPLGAPTLRCAPPQSPKKRTPPRFTLIVVAQNTRRYGHPCWSALVPSGWGIGPNCVLRLALFARLWAGEPEFLL